MGVWLATFVKQVDYTPVLLRVLADEYAPFGVWLRYALVGGGWLAIDYFSARFRYRIPYLLYCFAAGYWMGRIALFCVTAGLLGIVGLVVIEGFCFVMCYIASLAYYAYLADSLFCTLRPSHNRTAFFFGLKCLVVLLLALFVFLVVIWGLAAKIINLS